MDKIKQMEELILKVQKDAELQKEITAILQTENPEDTTKADQWLADNGYVFTLRELVEHLEDGIPLSDEQLEAVAGGKTDCIDVLSKIGDIVLIGIAGNLASGCDLV